MNRLSVPVAAALFCASLALTGCAGAGKGGAAARLDVLASWMAGTFSSEAQSAQDPEHFLNVRLIMAPIWPERRDGRWLYVEQAMADKPDRPYRQRIYRVTSSDAKTFISEVYTLPGDPLGYAGAWQDPSKFNDLTPQLLTTRAGCEITLTWDEAKREFRGATGATSCPSDLRGASYATSEVTVRHDGLVSWDRGFDASGNQVWGATMGGYQFVKVSN
ncbi:MAG: chromophore lyase CpcT/CpeT [Planctomycetes bacterium]|nr:chromophore lyase CpcT/CpeT [Planctomycetota bacterium]